MWHMKMRGVSLKKAWKLGLSMAVSAILADITNDLGIKRFRNCSTVLRFYKTKYSC